MKINNIINMLPKNTYIPTLVLIGASGCGKDTIQKTLINRGVCDRVVTYTTRPKRAGEIDGVDYHFVTEEVFKELNLFESREYHTLVEGKPSTWYYGSKIVHSVDKIPCIILTPDGAKNWKQQGNDIFIAYIDVPDSIRKERAMKRGSFDETEWERRALADGLDFSPENLHDKLDDDYVRVNGIKSVDEIVNTIIKSYRYNMLSEIMKEFDEPEL